MSASALRDVALAHVRDVGLGADKRERVLQALHFLPQLLIAQHRELVLRTKPGHRGVLRALDLPLCGGELGTDALQEVHLLP